MGVWPEVGVWLGVWPEGGLRWGCGLRWGNGFTWCTGLQEVLDQDMPDLPEYQAPQEDSDISIELQFPALVDVSVLS